MIPSHISVLHVEQEVEGDNTIALESVLECDEERENLLKEEKEISLRLSSRWVLIRTVLIKIIWGRGYVMLTLTALYIEWLNPTNF